jgi:hypothetical protein
MEDQFDAILYLGPPSIFTKSQLSRALCADRGYMEMRLWRLSLAPPPPGAPFVPADRLKQYCAVPDGNVEIPDTAPDITNGLREIIGNAALGRVDDLNSSRFAPESRQRLTAFLKANRPRFLGPLGKLESLILLADSTVDGKRVRRYRAQFATGRRILWTVGLSPEGAIVSLDPQPE